MPAILHLQTHTQGDGLGLGELRTNSSHRKRVEHFNYSYARWILFLPFFYKNKKGGSRSYDSL
jgi:hypothetical protein